VWLVKKKNTNDVYAMKIVNFAEKVNFQKFLKFLFLDEQKSFTIFVERKFNFLEVIRRFCSKSSLHIRKRDLFMLCD